MDVAAFAQELLLKLCEVEADAGRVGEWVLGTDSVHVATHVDRVFSFVTELRQRCLGCGRASIIPLSESVLCLPLEGVGMAEVTISELYLRSCAVVEEEAESGQRFCTTCVAPAPRRRQHRLAALPNVLLVHIRRWGSRGERLRTRVQLEEEVSFEGLGSMELAGVVCHRGRTPEEGRHAAVCRDADGAFWRLEDDKTPVFAGRGVPQGVASEVVLVAFCRPGGSAHFAAAGAADDVVARAGSGRGADGPSEPAEKLDRGAAVTPPGSPARTGGAAAARQELTPSASPPHKKQSVDVGSPGSPPTKSRRTETGLDLLAAGVVAPFPFAPSAAVSSTVVAADGAPREAQPREGVAPVEGPPSPRVESAGRLRRVSEVRGRGRASWRTAEPQAAPAPLGGDAQAVRRVWRGAPEEPRSGVQTRSQARAAAQAQAHEAEQGRGRGAGRGGRR